MKPYVHRLPIWLASERPWMVIGTETVEFFATWVGALHHATRIA